MADIHLTIDTLSRDKSTPLADPVTGQMITWLTNDMLTPDEVAIKEQLDIFFPWAIERAHKDEGHFRGLRDRAVRNVAIDLACIAAAVAVTMAVAKALALAMEMCAESPNPNVNVLINASRGVSSRFVLATVMSLPPAACHTRAPGPCFP